MVTPHAVQGLPLPHAERLLQLQQIGQLRPILFNNCTLSIRQRNELIEFLILLRSRLNNEQGGALDFIIGYANDHLIRPIFHVITDSEYIDSVRDWIDLSTWNNVAPRHIAAILRHYRDSTLVGRLDEMEARLDEMHRFVIGSWWNELKWNEMKIYW